MWQKLKNIYHLCVAILANIYYGFPGRKLTIIGVTGTDGKTTTSSLIYHILKSAGYKVSLISTVSAIIHDEVYDTGFHVTNPTSFPLQKFLAEVVKKGDTHLVLEVTSHGLDQNRVWGIPFMIAVLTNITHEHLDYHKTYSEYVQAKVKLLNTAKVAIVNKDDRSYHKVKYFLKNGIHLVTYGLSNNASVNTLPFSLPPSFRGLHNQYNALAALAVGLQLGIASSVVRKGCETFTFPKGRVEVVYQDGFTVMVDFAHTPNAFAQLLSSLRKEVKGRIIHVFGSAGQRDVTKRPLMGKEASLYDDVIILTAEDPRKEKIAEINIAIRREISASEFSVVGQSKAMHLEKGKKYILEILDRQKAIDTAIRIAEEGDFVIVTGKGHEQSMNYGKGEEPWNEFKAVEEALNKRIRG